MYIDLIHNLALLVALSAASGFIGRRWAGRQHEVILQGLLFGSVTVIGMLNPMVIRPGLIFDGRSVMISLCGLFFGPVATSISGTMAIVCRIIQGGVGWRMGVLVVLSSALVGLIFYRRQNLKQTEISSGQIWIFGLIVHAAMLLMTLALPPEIIIGTLKKIGWPVILTFPLATVLAGKILSDQKVRTRFLNALRQSKEELRTTLYSLGDAVISTDTKGRIRQMNPAAEKLTGWFRTDAWGKPLGAVFRIINENTREPIENPVQLVLISEQVIGLANHTLLIAKDGSERPIADSAAPILSREGRITGVVLVFRDQTKERAALTALKESEDRFRTLFHQAPLGYQSLDKNGCLLEVNQAWLETLGYRQEEISGKWFGDFLAPEQVEAFRRRFPEFKARGKVQTAFWMIHKDGSRRFISFDGKIGHHPDGSFKQTHCILADITEKKIAEDALRKAERQWEATFDAANDAVCLLDENQKIVRCNRAMTVLAGCEKSELIGKHCWEVVHKTNAPLPDCPVTKMTSSKKREWTELRIGDCWYEVTADPLINDEGELSGAVHVIRDITARKTAEDALKQIEWMLTKKPADTNIQRSGQPYGDLTELNHDGLILKSVGREMLKRIADDYIGLLGTSPAIYEADGNYAFENVGSGWCQLLDQASRKLCNTPDNSTALTSEKWLCHESCWSACSKKAVDTGEPVDVECHGGIRLFAVPITANNKTVGAINFGYGDPPKDPEKLRQLADTYHVNYEELLRQAKACDSRPFYIIEMAKERLKTSARLIGLLVEIKQAEQEHSKLEAQLRQSQKMEAIGRLAGGIAHDFNNMLQVILGRTELLLSQTNPESPQAGNLTEISKAAQRSSDLTRQLLAFARKQTIIPEILDINENISNTLNMLRRLIGENISLNWMPSAGPLQVKMDPSQLNQILTNLAVNARDAITGTGRISIETGKAAFDDDYCKIHSGFIPGEYVLLAVSDSGCGMDKETCTHIFEPFFTTKELGQGSGLGLSTMYGIVRQNNGFINVYSEIGQGTTFKIYLPRYEESPAAGKQPKPRPDTPHGKETILFVEDEASLLTLGRMQLERLGYTVLASHLPEEALRLAGQHKGEIHLLITDVVMPGMSGLELSKKITAKMPQTKLLFMSGYTADIITNHGILADNLNFLQKPFSINELAEKVREVLSAQ